MSRESPSWNTYDPLGMNRIVRFPELYEIRISVFAPRTGSYASKFYFLEHLGDAGNALRAGAHATNCSYASADLSFAGFTFRIEYSAADDGTLTCVVTPIAVADPFTMLLVEVVRAWGLDGEVELGQNNAISFASASGEKIIVAAAQDYHSVHNPGTPIARGVYASEDDLLQSLLDTRTLNATTGTGSIAALGFTARIPLAIAARSAESVTVAPERTRIEVAAAIRVATEQFEKESPSIQGGPFEGCFRAVESVMNWMTVWDQLHEIPYSPVSRSWVDNYMVRIGFDPSVRGPLTGLWDCFFHTMLDTIVDPTLAEGNLRVVLDDHGLMPDGYPTNYIVSTFKSGDRSQPPLGSLAAWKLYRRFGNADLLAWLYPRLKHWRQWWKARRDGNADGLLEWGSNIDAPEQGNDAGTLFAAKCESGMDNSPLFDDADFDQAIGTMNLNDVGLNALFAADALYLSKIADALGKTADRDELTAEHRALVERINTNLWNEQVGAYVDRFWNGDFSPRLGPTTFYPLLALVPDADRAVAFVRRHLLNEDEFWGEYVIPTISRKDEAFQDQIYWRGRVWPSVNYLVYLGLRAYRLDDIAHELARRSVSLFMRDWKLRGHCHENYNAITGEADDVPVASSPGSNGSDRFYPWGALLALMGVEELFDVEIDEGIRFGCKWLDEEAHIGGIRWRGNSYSVRTSKASTQALRDGDEFFFSAPGTTVREFVATRNRAEFLAVGDGPTSFRIAGFEPAGLVLINCDGRECGRATADERGIASFQLDMKASYTRVLLAGDRP